MTFSSAIYPRSPLMNTKSGRFSYIPMIDCANSARKLPPAERLPVVCFDLAERQFVLTVFEREVMAIHSVFEETDPVALNRFADDRLWQCTGCRSFTGLLCQIKRREVMSIRFRNEEPKRPELRIERLQRHHLFCPANSLDQVPVNEPNDII